MAVTSVRSIRVFALFVLTPLVVAACGGGSSPTAPAVSTTGITISGTTDMLRVQENVTFAAVASRSDGSTQAITDWASDAPTVLTINASTGVATGLAAGNATITARHGGLTSTRLVRVVPHYQGTWTGRYLVSECSSSGDFSVIGWCSTLLGQNLPFGLVLSQTRDTVSGTVTFGEYTGSVSGSMTVGGALTLAGVAVSGSASISILSWNTNSATFGTMTGSFGQRVTSTAANGSVTQTGQILSASRSPGSTATVPRSRTVGPDTVQTMLERIVGR